MITELDRYKFVTSQITYFAERMGVTDHVWSIEELVAAATTEAPITDKPRFSRFQVIQGGRA